MRTARFASEIRPVHQFKWKLSNRTFLAAQGSYGRLYFTSNRPGGYGGYDLYYADKLVDGGFAVPVNLGPKINTFFDERTAYFDLRTTAYFCLRGLLRVWRTRYVYQPLQCRQRDLRRG